MRKIETVKATCDKLQEENADLKKLLSVKEKELADMDAQSKKLYLRMNSNFQDELDQLEAIKANEFGDAENELLQNELSEMNGRIGTGSFIRGKRESELTDADSFIQDNRDNSFIDGAI